MIDCCSISLIKNVKMTLGMSQILSLVLLIDCKVRGACADLAIGKREPIRTGGRLSGVQKKNVFSIGIPDFAHLVIPASLSFNT